MPEITFTSPGVFNREIDQTGRNNAPVGIGPAVIGPRSQGPAMKPVLLRDGAEDLEVFGTPSLKGNISSDFAAYAAKLALRQRTVPLTFIRVLGQSGTGVSTGYTVGGTYAIGASGSNVIALIHSSGAVSLEGTLTSSVDSLAINIAGHGSFTASLLRNDANYIKKVLNTDPTQYDSKKHFVFAVYDYAEKTPTAGGAFFVSELVNGDSYADAFITGSTTAVISQPFSSVEYDLFGFGSINAGDAANTQIKVSIRDIKKSPNPDLYEYGSFTVLVRRFADNDRNAEVLESFPNVNLDQNSPNYICRRIGDRYSVWNNSSKKFDEFGDYTNASKYVYVVPSVDLKNGNVPATALPYGFNGYRLPTSGAVSNKAPFPAVPYVQNWLYKNNFSTKVYWGVEVIANASGAINYGVPDKLLHIPTSTLSVSGTADADFSLKYLSASVGNISSYTESTRLTESDISALSTSIVYSASTETTPSASGSGGYTGKLSLENIENTDLAKFTFVINDGFDGVDIHKSDAFSPEDMTANSVYQTHAYKTALDMLSNPDVHNLSELALPGIHASLVVEHALEMVEDRGDMFYIIDLSGTTVDDAVGHVTSRQYNTNYAGTYYPWVKLFDESNNKLNYVPPGAIVPAAFIYNDKVSFSWFAPAGMNRGGLGVHGVREAKDKLTKPDRDKLYENRINPIGTFPNEGVVIWGQKTLQVQPSSLDRINVRRMLFRVRKLINEVARGLVFEPNIAATWQKFSNRVNPILDRVRQDAGIEEFRVILDDTTNTEDLIERNIMYGKILLKPTRAAEAVILDFVLNNNIALFNE